MKFVRKSPARDTHWQPVDPPAQLVPWEIIREDFGAFIILDEEAYLGVSVLCTREPLHRLGLELHFFPSPDTSAEDLARDDNLSVNQRLQEVSPRVLLGEDGNLKPGWYYRSLLQAMYIMLYLQAMYIMLYLDFTGGNTVKKCQSRGCLNYFRVGSQGESIYCSLKCANRASTRLGRGQEP